MEIYIICNNLYENNLTFSDKLDIERKKMTRPLSVYGEEVAKNISLLECLNNSLVIYSSMFSSSLATAKYLAERLNKNIVVEEKLNDCKVGNLGNKNLKMVKFMQNHDFNIKLNNGESLEEVASRISDVISKIIYLNKKAVVFTHRRTLLGFLIRHGKAAYNLEDDLVIEFNDKVIYDDTDKDVDIVKVTVENKKIVDIDVIDF